LERLALRYLKVLGVAYFYPEIQVFNSEEGQMSMQKAYPQHPIKNYRVAIWTLGADTHPF